MFLNFTTHDLYSRKPNMLHSYLCHNIILKLSIIFYYFEICIKCIYSTLNTSWFAREIWSSSVVDSAVHEVVDSLFCFIFYPQSTHFCNFLWVFVTVLSSSGHFLAVARTKHFLADSVDHFLSSTFFSVS